MSLTVKQLADNLNVSKTAIRKRFSEDFKSQYVETNPDGSFQIKDEGCKLIAESLRKQSQTQQTELDEFAETSENRELQSLINVQRETIVILQGQVAAKDQQIDRLQEQISSLQNELEKERQHSREQSDKLAVLADQAQQLHAAATIKKLPDNQDAKRHWWQRNKNAT